MKLEAFKRDLFYGFGIGFHIKPFRYQGKRMMYALSFNIWAYTITLKFKTLAFHRWRKSVERIKEQK